MDEFGRRTFIDNWPLPNQLQNFANTEQYGSMAPLNAPLSSPMSPPFATPSPSTFPPFFVPFPQRPGGPANDAPRPRQHRTLSPPSFRNDVAYPAPSAQQAGHLPIVGPRQRPAAPLYAVRLPSCSKFDNKLEKRNQKCAKKASSTRSTVTPQDDNTLSETSESHEQLQPRHKKVRITRGPNPYVRFESTELNAGPEESAQNYCSLLAWMLLAIVLAIVVIAFTGPLIKNLIAQFPPGGAIYKYGTDPSDKLLQGHDLQTGAVTNGLTESNLESCRWQDQYIGENLNRSVSPCVDFYSYVCSNNWFQQPNVSSQPYAYSAPASIMLDLWNFLKQDADTGSTSFIGEAALFMQNCVRGSNKDTDWNVLREMLAALDIAEWPYAGSATRAEAHTVAAKAEKMLGLSSIVSVSIRKRPLNREVMLHVNSPPVLLRRFKNAFPREDIKSYNEFIFKVLSLWNQENHDVVPSALRIVELEERISIAAAHFVRNVPFARETLPIATLISHHHWNWPAYFGHFIEESEGELSGDKIALLDPAYFNHLPTILSRSAARTILNYIGYKLIVSISPLLPPHKADFVTPLSYNQHLAGVVPKRLEPCFSVLERLYPRATRALVWSQVLKRAPTLLSGDIADDLRKMELLARQEMKQAAAKAPWMSQEEAAVAVLKVERLKVVLLETDSNETVHERHPASPLFKNMSLIEAFYHLQLNHRAEYWRAGHSGSFYEPLLDTDSAFRTVALYKPDGNEVLVSPATTAFIWTISRRLDVEFVPFYLGEVLRSIFLAMSILGSTIDADGDLRQWWTPATEERFIKNAECLQESFTDGPRLYVKEEWGDDSPLIEENVVDGAVLHPLYKIHRRLFNESGRSDLIQCKSEDFDPDKLFFINWASTFCEPERPETAPTERLRLKLSGSKKARLNIALSRFPPFSAAFSCPIGSEMKPSNACTFW
ncbi:hypothetical protein HPB48_000029 [Haemaphysalis longicornis]|uniref:Uncharacterized protein n=1 Tax=Haemaphysalis longicornis TaxID=44386 RepID=A0A9J6G6S1_HAELO|nr:hypothetical protein HPB48_000029 [Haemaphysalis longicornis]